MGVAIRRYIDILIITNERYSIGARGTSRTRYWCNMSVVTRQYLISISASSAKTNFIAYTYCSVGISDLKPLTGASADQLPHRKSRPLATA